MPFRASESVNLRFATGDPDSAVVQFEDRDFTVANGGLEQRGGAVRWIVKLPREPGKYHYLFSDGNTEEEGDLRVIGQQAARAPAALRASKPTRWGM